MNPDYFPRKTPWIFHVNKFLDLWQAPKCRTVGQAGNICEIPSNIIKQLPGSTTFVILKGVGGWFALGGGHLLSKDSAGLDQAAWRHGSWEFLNNAYELMTSIDLLVAQVELLGAAGWEGDLRSALLGFKRGHYALLNIGMDPGLFLDDVSID